MFWSSPARRTGIERGRDFHLTSRWAVVAVLALGVTACRAAGPSPSSDDVAGPAWRTEARRGPGAATQTSPAVLTCVSIQVHDAYDRVVFDFDGNRPGYWVAYEDRVGGLVLRVMIDHIDSRDGRRLTPEAEAVREVVQHPARDLVMDTVMGIAAGKAGARQPFRVGLDVGEFYIDISHPDEALARPE